MGPVLHHEHLQLLRVLHMSIAWTYLNVVYQYVLKSVRVDVSHTFSCSIPNLGHAHLTFESTTDSVVDTLRLPPLVSKSDVSIALMPMPLLHMLFHYFRVWQRFNRHAKYTKIHRYRIKKDREGNAQRANTTINSHEDFKQCTTPRFDIFKDCTNYS